MKQQSRNNLGTIIKNYQRKYQKIVKIPINSKYFFKQSNKESRTNPNDWQMIRNANDLICD